MTDRESLLDLLTEGGMSREEALREAYQEDAREYWRREFEERTA